MAAVKQLKDVRAHDETAAPIEPPPFDGPEPGIVETPSHRKIFQACAHAHKGQLVLIYGGAGVGKTTALARYAAEHRDPGKKRAHHINLLGVKSPAAMLQAIAEGTGARAAFGAYRNMSLLRALSDELYSDDLLCLDEAQSLRPDALDAVRFFLDERGIGLVLAGNELIWSSVAGKRRRAIFAQLHSRVAMRLHVPHPSEADADAVLSAWGVSDRSGRDYGRQLALGFGALRQLVLVLRQARVVAIEKRRALDGQVMYSVASSLGLAD